MHYRFIELSCSINLFKLFIVITNGLFLYANFVCYDLWNRLFKGIIVSNLNNTNNILLLIIRYYGSDVRNASNIQY